MDLVPLPTVLGGVEGMKLQKKSPFTRLSEVPGTAHTDLFQDTEVRDGKRV